MQILYENKSLIAVNKPSFIPVHPSPYVNARTSCMQILRDQIGQYVYPLHRLDNQTSGVLLFSKDKSLLSTYMHFFEAHLCHKSYLAITRGWLQEQVHIKRPLKKENGNKLQEAETDITSIAHSVLPWKNQRYQETRFSLVRAFPKTGRMHQVRRHLAGINHPIVGDTKHGDSKLNLLCGEKTGQRRLLLHAEEIRIPHPENKTNYIQIHAPLDESLRHYLKILGLYFVVAPTSELNPTHPQPLDQDER